MTTVARGRWTSAPVPVANAIGTKPSDATSAVIRTGRNRTSAPSRTASDKGRPSSSNPLMKAIITSPLSTATPDNAMNPTPAEIERECPGARVQEFPSKRERNASEDDQPIAQCVEHHEQQHEDQQ